MSSAEQAVQANAGPLPDPGDEARRVLAICNACRYCEGYCGVFPAMTLRRSFDDATLDYFANLCHNCRGCYYACQYAPPHDFAINLPATLADLRTRSWAEHAWPRPLARAFAANGLVLSLALAIGLAVVLWLAAATGADPGAEAFYAIIPHGAMVALFGPVFVLALLAMAVGAVRFWRATEAPAVRARPVTSALHDVLSLRHLGGGHGEGCNYEAAEAYSNTRRRLHHAVFYGFALCFASTSVATVMHYVLDAPAPYGPLSLPKLLGVPGGIALSVGTAGLLWLRRRSDAGLGATRPRGMESGFTALLFLTGSSGLALYWLRDTGALAALLAVHLGAVLALFATFPYSKMVHGVYRAAALIRYRTENG